MAFTQVLLPFLYLRNMICLRAESGMITEVMTTSCALIVSKVSPACLLTRGPDTLFLRQRKRAKIGWLAFWCLKWVAIQSRVKNRNNHIGWLIIWQGYSSMLIGRASLGMHTHPLPVYFLLFLLCSPCKPICLLQSRWPKYRCGCRQDPVMRVMVKQPVMLASHAPKLFAPNSWRSLITRGLVTCCYHFVSLELSVNTSLIPSKHLSLTDNTITTHLPEVSDIQERSIAVPTV